MIIPQWDIRYVYAHQTREILSELSNGNRLTGLLPQSSQMLARMTICCLSCSDGGYYVTNDERRRIIRELNKANDTRGATFGTNPIIGSGTTSITIGTTGGTNVAIGTSNIAIGTSNIAIGSSRSYSP
jgi:hypothetical protein